VPVVFYPSHDDAAHSADKKQEEIFFVGHPSENHILGLEEADVSLQHAAK